MLKHALVLALFALLATAPGGQASLLRHDDAPRLIGRAVLPADTLAPGPVSGGALGTAPINGRTRRFRASRSRASRPSSTPAAASIG